MLIEKLDHWDEKRLVLAASDPLLLSSLISELEHKRGKGRNDYPIQTIWKFAELIVAGRFSSVQSLRKTFKGEVPSPFSFSRFLASVASLFDPINQLLLEWADPGEIGAVGTILLQQERCTFLWDIETGLPFYWELGSKNEPPSIPLSRLLSKIPKGKLRYLVGESEYAMLAREIWSKWRIRPIIPPTSQNFEKKVYKKALYDGRGEVFCLNASMVFGGFEEERETLKFLCPAKHYGYVCKDLGHCPLEKNIRIPLAVDPNIFTPLPRVSYRWQSLWSLYQRREIVEKILLSRIPRSGKKRVFLLIASLLFAAAYRTKKLSKRP